MVLGVLKEIKEHERRVALTPEVVKLLIKKGFQVQVESDAGLGSNFSNQDYSAAGAEVVDKEQALGADVILKVNSPSLEEAAAFKSQAVSISLLYPYTQPELVDLLN